MRIRNILFTGISVLAVSGLIIGVALFLVFQNTRVALEKDKEAEAISRSAFNLTVLTQDVLLHYGKRSKTQWFQSSETMRRRLSTYLPHAAEESILSLLKEKHGKVARIFKSLVAARESLAERPPDERKEATVELEQRLNSRLMTEMQTMVSLASQLANWNRRQIKENLQHVVFLYIFLGLGVLIVLTGALLVVVRRITVPIQRLQEGMGIIASGNLDYRVGTESRDEIGYLSRSFDKMTEDLKQTEERVDSRTAELKNEIKERQLFENALRESEQRYRTLVEGQSDLICRNLGDGTLLSVNEAYGHFFGKTPDDLEGYNFLNFLPKEFHQSTLDFLASLTPEKPTATHEHEVVDGSGNIRWMQWTNTAMFGPDGNAREFVAMGRDITESKRAEEELLLAKKEAEHANQAKSEFLASMSHDLRTPLNAIMGFAEIMEAKIFGPLGDPHYEEYAKDIHDGGSLLVSLIDDILDISKIEAGKYELDEETLDVSLLIQSSVKMISTQAEAGKLHLATDMEPNPPMLRGDKRAITQILNNLLSNAVKFTPVDGKVTVSAKLDGNGSINVLVADTGEGMSSHDIAKALNPFEQADSVHARRHEGTGLGLYLCQKLIRLHDGDIMLQSKAGKGTTVTMRFPPERTVAS